VKTSHKKKKPSKTKKTLRPEKKPMVFRAYQLSGRGIMGDPTKW
jgi:hypothetical protein